MYPFSSTQILNYRSLCGLKVSSIFPCVQAHHAKQYTRGTW